MIVSVLTPHQQSLWIHPSAEPGAVKFLNFCQFNSSLNLHFPVTNELGHLSIFLMAICISPSLKCLFLS